MIWHKLLHPSTRDMRSRADAPAAVIESKRTSRSTKCESKPEQSGLDLTSCKHVIQVHMQKEGVPAAAEIMRQATQIRSRCARAMGSWALQGLVWRLGRHGSARGWLTAESWRQGWGEAERSGSAWCCAPAGMPSSRRPRPRARTPWGIGAPESCVEASCAAVSPESRGEPFRGSAATPQPRGYPEATSLLYLNLPQA